MKKLLSLLLLVCLSSFAFAGTITSTGYSQGDVYNLLNGLQLHALYHGCEAVSLNLTASPNQQDVTPLNTATYATANAKTNFGYVAGGNLYSKTFANIDLSGITGASALPVQPISSVRTYMIGINSSGTYGVSYAIGNVQPKMLSGYTPLWTIKVTTSAAATYTFGTTKLNATGITKVITNINALSTGANKISLTY